MAQTKTKSMLSRNLSVIEEICKDRDWKFGYDDENIMTIDLSEDIIPLIVNVEWDEKTRYMLFRTILIPEIPNDKLDTVNAFTALINPEMMMGNFEVDSSYEDLCLNYRQAFPVLDDEISIDQAAEIIDISVLEALRVWPAMCYIMEENKTAKEAVAAAMISTIGEA